MLVSDQRRTARLLNPVFTTSPTWNRSPACAATNAVAPLRSASTVPSFSTSTHSGPASARGRLSAGAASPAATGPAHPSSSQRNLPPTVLPSRLAERPLVRLERANRFIKALPLSTFPESFRGTSVLLLDPFRPSAPA